MTSAPLRPTQTAEAVPNIKTRGHLALIEWDDAPLRFAPAPVEAARAAAVNQPFGPKKRSLADRCYDGGILALLAVTAAALAASLGRF